MLTDYQRDGLELLHDAGRLAFTGPRGAGKTFEESLAILHFAETRNAARLDWAGLVLSGSWDQVRAYLWPEIRRLSQMADLDRLRRPKWRDEKELLRTELQLSHGRFTSGSPTRAALIEGLHAHHVLVVIDEAKSVADPVWDSLEGSFSNIGAASDDVGLLMAGSTPGAPAGRLYDLSKRKPGTEDWAHKKVTSTEVIAAGRMSQEWADQRRKQWGEKSWLFQNHVLGNFAAQDDQSLIPLAWIEDAVARWHILNGGGR